MEQTQVDKYQELMEVIRSRFDSIDALSKIGFENFNNTEMAAFHGRKIVEGIAFACLIATKNGFKTIPRDAEGQYNAEKILKTLLRKGIETFPSPSFIRNTTEEEEKKYNAKVTVEGVAERRITQEELIKKYQRLHNWAHELNPYVKEGHFEFNQKHREQLEKDLFEIKLFLDKHFISINGEGFFCVLKDDIDGKTKVISLSKTEDLPEDLWQKTGHNSRLAKKRFQCLNEALCFVKSSVLADNLVLRNPLLRQAPKRKLYNFI